MRPRSLFLILLVPLALLIGCNTVTPKTPRERLVAAELSYQAALSEIRVLADAGLIKGETATIVAASVRTLDASMQAWRMRPDDPDYMAAGHAALAPLLKLIAAIRGVRASLDTGPPLVLFATLTSDRRMPL